MENSADGLPVHVEEFTAAIVLQHASGRMYPISQRGLHRTQKSTRRLSREHKGSELLFPSGEIFPIFGFSLGRATDTGLAWPLHWITLTGERHLTLRVGPPRTPPFDDIKLLVVTMLEREPHPDEWAEGSADWDRLNGAVASATDTPGVFAALRLLRPDAGLDVFS